MLELLVVLATFSIISAIGASNLPSARSSFVRADARQQFKSDLQRMRAEAQASGGRILLTFNAAHSGYSVGVDYRPFSLSSVPDEILFQRKFESEISIASTHQIIFDPRGLLVDSNGDLTTSVLSIGYEGIQFVSGTLYSTGYWDLVGS